MWSYPLVDITPRSTLTLKGNTVDQKDIFGVTIHPLTDPHYFNLLNTSWPSDHLVVSFIFGQEYFTFLYGHTKHNIHDREGGE